ncbi:hypothetical protein Mucpa_0276 [Mucilaginibacter paludis DSM 18603]|uniref:Uncharacterized protein n=1 Tax=Mucilaginibacter paludis DSM 18603 TaxID=714943 RepID=H1YGC1_9SPHI|nr:hypothetical protein Mucpa_0276 [Mucilaginibacter paludis DSM 18603]
MVVTIFTPVVQHLQVPFFSVFYIIKYMLKQVLLNFNCSNLNIYSIRFNSVSIYLFNQLKVLRKLQ